MKERKERGKEEDVRRAAKREGVLGEDDVGKEEANQKRKYALARPEALRKHSRPCGF